MPSPDPLRTRQLVVTGVVWAAVTVVWSVVGAVVGLPGSPHATSDRVTLTDVLVGQGTTMSPPLYLTVVVVLLLLGAGRGGRTGRVCAVLLALLTAYTAVFGIVQLTLGRPPALDAGRWTLGVALAVVFVVCCVAVVGAVVRTLRAEPARR